MNVSRELTIRQLKKSNLYSKKHRLLSGGITKYTRADINSFKVDDIALYSITSAKIAHTLANEISELLGTSGISITDATASVGGNSIPFMKHSGFNTVNMVELSASRFKMLKHNITLTHSAKNHTLHNCSYLDIYDTLTQDIVFMDPPWGGPEYKLNQSLHLFLGGINISVICNNIFSATPTKYIIIKVPINFNTESFIENVQPHLVNKMSISIFSKKMSFYSIENHNYKKTI